MSTSVPPDSNAARSDDQADDSPTNVAPRPVESHLGADGADGDSRPELNVAEISREYFPRIRRAALLLTGNPWDADDLAQETFAIFAKQENGQTGTRFAGRSQIYTWLYGILLNLERRERRRQEVNRRKLRVIWEEGNRPGRAHIETASPTEVAEWKRGLWGLVADLPDGQRQTLVLRFGQGLRYDEIAAALDCPLGTVKSRIFHGLLNLRSKLGHEAIKNLGLDAALPQDVPHVPT